MSTPQQTQLKRALLALQKMQTKITALENKPHEAIAIVGMGCRLPGEVDSPETLWQLLQNEVDAISEIPADRWDIETYYDPNSDALGKMVSRYGGFLQNIDQFDAAFFSISPGEALSLDPQQRLLLEVTWQALEHAAIAPSSLKESQTGVFIGISGSEYSQQLLTQKVDAIDSYFGSGNAHSAAVGRLSYTFGLLGPSIAIDTACSSSLVAIHLACQSLRQEECDLAISGGVNALITPYLSINHSRAKMLAADGRCKTFDAAADGFVRSEGCGIIILKRLSDVTEQDHVMAVIRGSAVNQDGQTSGMTVPNGPSQQAVIIKALANAKLKAEQVSYIEAHGTGTSLGDPIEMDALKAVFAESHKDKSLRVGSIKTNLGHLEAASGITGLMKVVLSLQQAKIPAHLHFKQANPHLNLEQFPGNIVTELQAWTTQQKSRVAGVSAFGFGGTNAHVVVEEAEHKSVNGEKPLTYLFTLSAQSKPALQQLVLRYQDYFAKQNDIDMANLCFSVNCGRSHFSERLAIVANEVSELIEKLNHITLTSTASQMNIAFLFTGQGAQYPKMAQACYQHQPVFRRTLQQCDELLQKQMGLSILSLLYETDDQVIEQTQYTQPIHFAVQYSLAKLWLSWGLNPDYLLGHSVGEYVAACLAEVFSLQAALKLVVARGQLMHQHCKTGAMLALHCTYAEAKDLIAEDATLSIAAVNAETKVVISGPLLGIETIMADTEFRCKRLAVSYAFHSPMMRPMLDDFAKIAQEITYQSPQIDIISSVTGTLITDDIACPDYWVKHIQQPVLFAQAMHYLLSTNCNISLEIGTKPILTSLLDKASALSLTSLQQNKADQTVLLESLATLYRYGFDIDWAGFAQGYAWQRMPLPTYAFQRSSYWIKANNSKQHSYGIIWKNLENQQTPKDKSSTWLIFGTNFQQDLKQCLDQRQQKSIWISAGQAYQQIDKTHYLLDVHDALQLSRLFTSLTALSSTFQVLYVASPEQQSESELAQQALSNGILFLSLVQNLGAFEWQATLWLLTLNAQSCDAQDEIQGLAQSPLWGLAKNIALEYPKLWGGAIDIENNEQVAYAIDDILQADDEQAIVFRKNRRYVARLNTLTLPQTSPQFSNNGHYLITGGLGAFGLLSAEYLLTQGVQSLTLLGRRAHVSATTQTWLQKWRSQGARINIVAANVADRAQMSAVFNQIKQTNNALKGIIHAAGSPGFCTLPNLQVSDIETMFAAKVRGTCLLSELSQGESLDFFITCSSMVSVWGAKGQAHYVAANHFMDNLMQQRLHLGLPAKSYNWGPMTGGGMLSTAVADELTQIGVHSLTMQQCVDFMFTTFNDPRPQIIMANIDWSKLIPIYEQQRPFPLFSEITYKKIKIKENVEFQNTLIALPISERPLFLKQHLISCLAETLGFQSNQVINDKQGFFDLGMDSLTAMTFRNQLQQSLQVELPATLAFDYNSIAHLADYFMAEVFSCEFVVTSVVEPVTELEDISEDAIEQMLRDKLKKLQD